MIPYFIWNNISSIDRNIIVNELPPITIPKKRIEEKQIPGRNGKLYIDEGVYDTFVYQIKCTLGPNANVREISRWLSGTGRLVISLEEDKYYEGIIKNNIDFSKVLHVFYEFPIEIELQPFAYSLREYEHNFSKASVIYITQSTAEICPYIKIEGSGAVTLTIGNKSQRIKKVEGYIELDSKIEEAYKGNKNENSNVLGEFLKLKPGENKIEWIGSITNLKIKYRETYL